MAHEYSIAIALEVKQCTFCLYIYLLGKCLYKDKSSICVYVLHVGDCLIVGCNIQLKEIIIFYRLNC